MAIIKLWICLMVWLVPEMVMGFASPGDANKWEIQQPHDAKKETRVEIVYENDSDSMLPLLSRDLTLLGQAIDMIGNDACKSQCKLMINGIRNLTSWAVRFYDASGKFPEGVLGGSLYQLGNFDECLQIGQFDDSPPGVYGQYCLGEVEIGVPNLYLNRSGSIWEDFRPSAERWREEISKLHWGICVPAACAPHDVEEVVRTVLAVAFSGSRLKLTPRIPEKSCYKIASSAYNNVDIVYTCLILSLIFFLVIGTIFHIRYLIRDENIPEGLLPQVLVGFSVIMNLKKLCGGPRKSGINLDCISGIKVIAMVSITIVHSLLFVISAPVLNLKFWQYAVTKLENVVFTNNSLLVDTFLLLSGFLVACLILGELNKGSSVNFLHLYVLRYIRLTPAYFVIIGLYMTWFSRINSGPMWSRVLLERDRCLASWWTNLLYINNYVNTDKLCMFQSWYLSVDTQLFLLAPLVIYPLYKWRRFGEFLLASVTVLSIVIPFVVTLTNGSDPTLMIYSTEMKDISTNNFFITNYIKTHMKATSYCFGLICGYVVHRLQVSSYKLSTKTVRFGWLFASVSLVGSLSTILIFYGPRRYWTPVEAAMYAAFHRTFWSIGTAWVVLACVTGNGGFVAKILQWSGFVPLSRLTYSAYLVNGMVELYNAATARSPEYLDVYNLIRHSLADVMVTFMCALVLCMMCESPILGLEKILLSRGRRKPKSDKKGESEETNTTEA